MDKYEEKQELCTAKALEAEDNTIKIEEKIRSRQAGVTTVEVILVLVVLLAIVVIFREQLTDIVSGIFEHVSSTVNELY